MLKLFRSEGEERFKAFDHEYDPIVIDVMIRQKAMLSSRR